MNTSEQISQLLNLTLMCDNDYGRDLNMLMHASLYHYDFINMSNTVNFEAEFPRDINSPPALTINT
jgi:hypothetical protein